MLVLSRKKNESIVVDDSIVITVVEIRGDKVRLGIEAPREVPIHRSEVRDAMAAAQAEVVPPVNVEPKVEENAATEYAVQRNRQIAGSGEHRIASCEKAESSVWGESPGRVIRKPSKIFLKVL